MRCLQCIFQISFAFVIGIRKNHNKPDILRDHNIYVQFDITLDLSLSYHGIVTIISESPQFLIYHKALKEHIESIQKMGQVPSYQIKTCYRDLAHSWRHRDKKCAFES